MIYKNMSEDDIKNTLIYPIWQYAKAAHSGQNRKGFDKNGLEQPYHTHLFKVFELCMNARSTTDIMIDSVNISLYSAAMLHDVLEDTKTTPEQLYRDLKPIMGHTNAEKTVAIVKELTNPAEGFGTPDMTKEQRDEIKKEWQIKHAKTMSPHAKLIKIADQISNILDVSEYTMPSWDNDQKLRYICKANLVSYGCFVNTEKAPTNTKTAFNRMINVLASTTEYATARIKNQIKYQDLLDKRRQRQKD